MAKLRMIKETTPKERALIDMDDVRAILRFTEVDVNVLEMRARRENTLSIFRTVAPKKLRSYT